MEFNEFGAQFGMSDYGSLLDLQKALEAGYATDAVAQVGGGALRVESLEPLLKILTFQGEKHLPFWNMIPKTQAFSTVEEYTELSAYGQNEYVFQGEGVLPPTQDSTYARRAAFVKFIGVTKEVSHPMTLVRSQTGDVMARENMNGLLWVLRSLEEKLYTGQANLTVGGTTEGVEFNGVLRQVQLGAPSENVIDMAGKPLGERIVRDGAEVIQAAFGMATHLFGNPKSLSDLSKEYIPSERIALAKDGNGRITGGFVLSDIETGGGSVKLVGDNFLRKTITFPAVAEGSKPPAPAPVSATPALNASGTGRWSRAYPNGVTVQYRVTFASPTGQSVSVESASQAISVANITNRVDLTIVNPGGFTENPTSIRIYRRDDPGTTGTFGLYSLIARIPIATLAGGGNTVFQDINEKIPNTYDSYLMQLDNSVIEWKKLLDPVRMDLAVVAPAYRWMILMYGVPTVYAPSRIVVFRNVGDAA